MYSAPAQFARGLQNGTLGAHEIFVADSHRKALSALLQGIANRDPFITLIGEADVGKTTLVAAALLDPANTRTRVIRVSNPQGGAYPLPTIMAQLAGKGAAAGSAEAGAEQTVDALVSAGTDESRVVLIVDDAHCLSADSLVYMLQVSDIARGRGIPLQMIFVGRPALRTTLLHDELHGRIAVSGVVEPLSREEMLAYLRRHPLQYNAAPEMSDRKVEALVRRSGGFPGRIPALLEDAAASRQAGNGAAAWLGSTDLQQTTPLPLPAGRHLRHRGMTVLAALAMLGVTAVAVQIAPGLRRLPKPPSGSAAGVSRVTLPKVSQAEVRPEHLTPPPVAVKVASAAPMPPAAEDVPATVTRLAHLVPSLSAGAADLVSRASDKADMAAVSLVQWAARSLPASPLAARVSEPHPVAAAVPGAAPTGHAALAIAPGAKPASPSARTPPPRGTAVATSGLPGSPPPSTSTHMPALGATPPPASRPQAYTEVLGRPAAIARPSASISVARLISSGDAMLVVGNIAGARWFFERAVAANSGPAATRLGKTFDPSFLEAILARGVRPDISAAAGWYRRAVLLGDQEARHRLAALQATLRD